MNNKMTNRWYHRNINGVEAEKLLQEYGKDGSFLIRPSQSDRNCYTLSVRCLNTYKHIKIQNNGDCFEIGEGGDKFATLAELVDYFILRETLRDKNDGSILVLKYPLPNKEPTTERYYHGGIDGKDANQLLLEKGKPGSYLVRESRTNPQNYVLSVRCESSGKPVNLVIECTKDGYRMEKCKQSYLTLDILITELVKMCPIVDSRDNVIYLKQPLNASRVNAMSISNRVNILCKEMVTSKKSGFAEEFEALQQEDGKHLYERKEGEKPENRAKNRFKTILPFDHTRVVLNDGGSGDAGGEPSDYINANYIKSDDSFGKCYLATQGPLPNTVADFWRMIWQESSHIILMITHEIEKSKQKCSKYWPEVNQQVKYDNFLIKCTQINKYDDYLLRELTVSNSKDSNQDRNVFHFQYLAWDDHGVPENVRNTLKLIEHVNNLYKQYNWNTALTVHCSAGIGRTGAIILIDMIIDKIRHYGLQCDIDVQKTVLHLRSQRSGMVQTEKQYQFLYVALKEYIDILTQQQQTLKNKQIKPIYLASNSNASIGSSSLVSSTTNLQQQQPQHQSPTTNNRNTVISPPTSMKSNSLLSISKSSLTGVGGGGGGGGRHTSINKIDNDNLTQYTESNIIITNLEDLPNDYDYESSATGFSNSIANGSNGNNLGDGYLVPSHTNSLNNNNNTSNMYKTINNRNTNNTNNNHHNGTTNNGYSRSNSKSNTLNNRSNHHSSSRNVDNSSRERPKIKNENFKESSSIRFMTNSNSQLNYKHNDNDNNHHLNSLRRNSNSNTSNNNNNTKNDVDTNTTKRKTNNNNANSQYMTLCDMNDHDHVPIIHSKPPKNPQNK